MPRTEIKSNGTEIKAVINKTENRPGVQQTEFFNTKGGGGLRLGIPTSAVMASTAPDYALSDNHPAIGGITVKSLQIVQDYHRRIASNESTPAATCGDTCICRTHTPNCP